MKECRTLKKRLREKHIRVNEEHKGREGGEGKDASITHMEKN